MNPRSSFMKTFRETAPYHNRYEVFRDFVEMAGMSLYNVIYKDPEVEKTYLKTLSKYKESDQKKFPELLAWVVEGLRDPCDFLGSVFMELGIGNAGAGQFFTPYEVSYMMAKMLVGENREAVLGDKPFISVSEPAVGSAGMIIAFSVAMMEAGVNPQQEMWVECIDVDPLAVWMAYIQLTLLHIPAVVVLGNTIRGNRDRVMKTLSYVMGDWDQRIALRRLVETINSVATTIAPDTEEVPVDDAVVDVEGGIGGSIGTINNPYTLSKVNQIALF